MLAWYFASAYQSSSESVDARLSYDVKSIFQDGIHRDGNLLPASVLDDGTSLGMLKSGSNLPNISVFFSGDGVEM